jgi:hypothetical protein
MCQINTNCYADVVSTLIDETYPVTIFSASELKALVLLFNAAPRVALLRVRRAAIMVVIMIVLRSL